MAFLQSNGSTEDIWKWIASGLLAVLGWLLGKKDRRDSLGENSWEKRGSEVLLRIQQLEETNRLRIEHPEDHPVINKVNGIIGKLDNRLDLAERKIQDLENGR